MQKFIMLFVLAILLNNLAAQNINVVLKNNKIISGKIIKEEPRFIVVQDDTGELKIFRNNIESITYKSNDIFTKDLFNADSSVNNNLLKEDNSSLLNDIVVVYLKNDEVFSGILIAKSLDMILIKTEVGSLTIPKREIQKIEYVSSEYAERGEIVIAYLTNGTQFEGNIYYEDYQSLILDTKIGRLSIDKKNLRLIEYTGEKGQSEENLVSQYSTATKERPLVAKRLDVLSLGYSPSFGPNYGTGFKLGYNNKYLLTHLEGLYISALGGLNLHYFTLNKDNFNSEVPSVSASGSTFITSIIAGAAFTLYQNTNSNYEFYVAPQLEANLIYKSLTKEYPSYPVFDSKATSTDFVLGIGNKIGLDFKLNESRIGISYDLHFLFGDEDYNTISLNYTTSIF